MKVLFVSGYAENTVLRHGAIDVTTRFLQKPFSLKALARKIRDVLDADALVPAASAAAASAASASPSTVMLSGSGVSLARGQSSRSIPTP